MSPQKYRGLERAAHIGRLIATDTRAGDVPLIRTLRDIRESNAVAFDPPTRSRTSKPSYEPVSRPKGS